VARVLLDTTVLIDALRGRPAAERLRGLRSGGDAPMICAVNVEEMWRGVRPDEHDVIRRFLRGLRLVPLGHAEGERAGTWRRDHAARGVALHQADCFTAAAAVTAAAALATGNPSHFPMAEVEVDHWPVGQ
jgi:predicted nucleic acid-binding protein